ncbi:MAG: hypothetical protein AAB075_02935, partial [Gemmatimonadota bacterium]
MDDLRALRTLARALGVHARYRDDLGRRIEVAPETLVRVCASLGAPVTTLPDAAEALRAHRARSRAPVPPVQVAWDGNLPPLTLPTDSPIRAAVHLADGDVIVLDRVGPQYRTSRTLPLGHHRITAELPDGVASGAVISAPVHAWRRPGSPRGWGVGTQMAALRSARSRSLADLHDLSTLCRWVHDRGGDLVTVLPLLP